MKLLTFNWAKRYLEENNVDPEKVKQSFGLGATFRGILQAYIERELDKIDKESKLDNLSDKPNRAELLLAYQAKREALYDILEYIIDKS